MAVMVVVVFVVMEMVGCGGICSDGGGCDGVFVFAFQNK